MSELPAPRMTCREVVELLSELLDEALAPDARARVEAHLAACRDCRAHLAQLRWTIGALAELREDEVSPATLERFVEVFRDWRRA